MRVSTACLACRSRRRKCESLPGESSCVYCNERHIECSRKGAIMSNAAPERPNTTVMPPLSRETSQTTMASLASYDGGRRESNDLETTMISVSSPADYMPPADLQCELVQLYFDLIHDCFHCLFHAPTFMEAVQLGQAPPVIIFAMMALSARFSTNHAFAEIPPRQRSGVYYTRSAALLDLRDISLTTLQACVLLGAVNITEGDAAAESVYYSVACRIASLLDIARRPAADSIEQEVNIRVWHTLCMIDVWSSTGLNLPRQMARDETIQLPVDEGSFLSWKHGEFHDFNLELDNSRQSSLLAQMIKLNRILMEINDAIKRTVENGTDTIVLESTVTYLSMKLDLWYSELPDILRDTPENFQYWAGQGFGRFFAAVYLGYYHFGQLLFYQFLHEDCHADIPGAQFYASKCKEHAANLCKIVYMANSNPSSCVLYTMIGHILVVASSVQIHTLLFDTNEDNIAAARDRLEKNFETLSQLRNYWPTLEVCFSRLRTFHEVCRKNMDTSFRMDRWMLRFLSEYARPIDKPEEDLAMEELGLMTVENVGVSPENWI